MSERSTGCGCSPGHAVEHRQPDVERVDRQAVHLGRLVGPAQHDGVDVVGLSILSGAHLALTTRVVEGLRAAGAGDIAVVVGGTIPHSDVDKLGSAGAAGVYPTGTPLDVLVNGIRALTSTTTKETTRE